jgi:hypothetical protein
VRREDGFQRREAWSNGVEGWGCHVGISLHSLQGAGLVCGL